MCLKFVNVWEFWGGGGPYSEYDLMNSLVVNDAPLENCVCARLLASRFLGE